MNSTPSTTTARAIRTPRAAAVAGIVFSVLLAASVVLLEWALPSGSLDAGTWVEDDARRNAVSLSLQLLPFAGIAFLWFIGVLRDRIGSGEDRFFATVFLGRRLLFVAMFFVSGAVAAVYGLRMAAVFTISATTLATRLRLVPRWLAVVGYATAAVLLFGVGLVPYLQLVFPGWVFTLSVHLLIVTFGHGAAPFPGDDRHGRTTHTFSGA